MIHVIICARDCYEWFPKCIASVSTQDYDDKNIVLIDDASEDMRMRDEVKFYRDLEDFMIIQRVCRCGAVCNITHGILSSGAKNDDIIVLVDGDDWLPHAGVLSRVAQVYEENPDVWLTYGDYLPEPFDPLCPVVGPYPPEVVESGTYREHQNLFNHLITFKVALWNHVEASDLLDDHGQWLQEIYDEVIMYPMLEMARNHALYLPETLYIYNSVNPTSVSKKRPTEATNSWNVLMSRAPKAPLEEL